MDHQFIIPQIPAEDRGMEWAALQIRETLPEPSTPEYRYRFVTGELPPFHCELVINSEIREAVNKPITRHFYVGEIHLTTGARIWAWYCQEDGKFY